MMEKRRTMCALPVILSRRISSPARRSDSTAPRTWQVGAAFRTLGCDASRPRDHADAHRRGDRGPARLEPDRAAPDRGAVERSMGKARRVIDRR